MVASRSPDHDVRAATVAAATRLFAARGFEGTTLQGIADEVGVTKPAILHHFPSKEHVRQAVLESILTHWNEALPRLLLAATATKDRFDAVLGETHRFFAADPDRARLVVREALDRPAELRKVLRGPVRRWLGAVADYVKAGREMGHHHADVDPEAYVIHILLLCITATASASLATVVLEGSDARSRFDRELARIAHSSLFPARTAAAAPADATTGSGALVELHPTRRRKAAR